MTEDAIRNALSVVRYPGFSRDIISFGLVKSISIENGVVSVGIQIQTSDPKVPEQIFKDCHEALDEMAGDSGNVQIKIDIMYVQVKINMRYAGSQFYGYTGHFTEYRSFH